MQKIFIALSILCLGVCCFAQGEFYREHWAEFDPNVSNHKDGRWRVNDADLSLHERFGIRSEARANGLVLLNAPEDLFQLQAAELYLELWGGHGKTANKRFFLNGRGPYMMPLTGTEEGHETYSYPSIPLKIQHMVNGINAFQFACDRDKTFWGHFIIDNVCVRSILKPEHPLLSEQDLTGFQAEPALIGDKSLLGEKVKVFLSFDKKYQDMIQAVDFYGRYLGFDDTGNRMDDDWHGFSFERKPVNHLGTATAAPFEIEWDTGMIPDQSKPMAIKAVVHLKNQIFYRTSVLDGLEFAKKRNVVMYHCKDLPIPFHSRASRESMAKFYLPNDLTKLQRAQLWIKTWDGGEGTVKEPFTINGHPYHVISGQHIHDVVFTVAEMEKKHLKPGENIIRLFSDTEHHGIEILTPGPCFILRYK